MATLALPAITSVCADVRFLHGLCTVCARFVHGSRMVLRGLGLVLPGFGRFKYVCCWCALLRVSAAEVRVWCAQGPGWSGVVRLRCGCILSWQLTDLLALASLRGCSRRKTRPSPPTGR